ncbi:paired domain-containing protein [Trichonephila clavipes]|nr:paired domain-containing protein [Trichonephila clavipes]
MSKRSRLPDSLRWKVVGWIEMGLSHTDAARRHNVSRSVVHRLCNQYQIEASVSRRHVPGRPRTTTPAGDRFIAVSARRRRWISVPQLVADHSVASGRRIFASTVRMRLHNSGLYARRSQLCVYPSTDVIEGLAYLGQENTFPGPNSDGLLYSTDESRFTLESDSGRLLSGGNEAPDIINLILLKDKATEVVE